MKQAAPTGRPALLSPAGVTMPYTPILGSLGYVLSPDGERVLLVHRNARPDDQHLGKYNGLGGKMEPGEDIVGCMRRELLEEAGITAMTMSLRGTINWTGFGPNGEDWLGFIFLITVHIYHRLDRGSEGDGGNGAKPVHKRLDGRGLELGIGIAHYAMTCA